MAQKKADERNSLFRDLYAIICVLLIVLVISGGIPAGIVDYTFNDYIEHHVIDGYTGNGMFLIYNLIIILGVFVASLVITVIKSNKLKHKYLVFAGIVVLLLLIPIRIDKRSGGLFGEYIEKRTNIIGLSLEFEK